MDKLLCMYSQTCPNGHLWITATCQQRPVCSPNGQSEAYLPLIFLYKPLHNGHVYQVPRAAVVHRFDCTVKPVLTATSEQYPPLNNGQPKDGRIKFNTNFDWKPSKKRPPLYNSHYFGVPRVALVDRFDCSRDILLLFKSNF